MTEKKTECHVMNERETIHDSHRQYEYKQLDYLIISLAEIRKNFKELN